MTFRVEVDCSGDGTFATYQQFVVDGRKNVTHKFPKQFGAYWVRVVADANGAASAEFEYE